MKKLSAFLIGALMFVNLVVSHPAAYASDQSEFTTEQNVWTPPQKEDLVHNGEQISDDTYNILLNTAKLFGIDKYEIVWSDHPVEYGYTDPGLFYCMRNGIAYGYGVQVIPGSDVTIVAEGMKKLSANGYKKLNYIAYRPLVEDDNLDYVLENFSSAEGAYKTDVGVVAKIKDITESMEDKEANESYYLWDLDNKNALNSFQFFNWYLIPIDDNGQKFELNYYNSNYDTSVEAGATSKYWVNNTQLTSGGVAISRLIFNCYIDTAKKMNMPGFKIIYNNSEKQPTMYSFIGSYLNNARSEIAVQVIPTQDVVKVIDVYAACLEEAKGDEGLAEVYYSSKWLNLNFNPRYYWTLAECSNKETTEKNVVFRVSQLDNYKNYALIPLDENGREDLRLYIDGVTASSGDVNDDGVCSIADLIIMQKWLLNEPAAGFTNWKAADLNYNSVLDTFDFVLMKMLITTE